MNPDEVKKQIEDLEVLRARLRRWRTGIVLLIIVIMGGAVTMIVDSALDLTRGGPEQEQFVTELTQGLKDDVVPHLEKIGRQTLNEAKPIIEKELKKLNDRSPEMAVALKKESELLTHNLPVRADKVLNSTFGAVLKKREAKIREMYPDATEERVSTLVANLTEVAHERADAVANKLFEPHIVALHGIIENLDNIKKSEVVNGNDELPTWEMALLIFDVVREDFKGLESDMETPTAKTLKTKKVSK